MDTVTLEISISVYRMRELTGTWELPDVVRHDGVIYHWDQGNGSYFYQEDIVVASSCSIHEGLGPC